MKVLCEVCKEVNSKYKCSTCFCPYCSLDCWKKHKTEDNCKPKPVSETTNTPPNNPDKEKYFTEDTVSEEKLNQLSESKALRNMLTNKYLQNVLIGVDNASNPEDAIRQAMKNPEFVEFVDECLKIVEDSND